MQLQMKKILTHYNFKQHLSFFLIQIFYQECDQLYKNKKIKDLNLKNIVINPFMDVKILNTKYI